MTIDIRAARVKKRKKKKIEFSKKLLIAVAFTKTHSSSFIIIAPERRTMANVANGGVMAEVNLMLEEMFLLETGVSFLFLILSISLDLVWPFSES